MPPLEVKDACNHFAYRTRYKKRPEICGKSQD